jgi:hypothetical protein
VDILLSEGYLNKAEAQLKAAQLKEAETKAQLEQNETKRILLEQTKRDQEEYQRLIEEAKKEAANSN